MRTIIQFILLFLLTFTAVAQENMLTIPYLDTMALTQENFDRLDPLMWEIYGSRRFEKTLPYFKAMWDRGARDYAAKQDSMSYWYQNFGQATYAQWLTLLGRYDEGLPLFEEALSNNEHFFGPTLRLSHGYVGLGIAYSQFGDPYRALWAQNQAARIVDINIKPGHPRYGLVGNKLGNLARVYGDLKQPRKAIQLFEDAEAAYRTAGFSYGVLTTFWGRGKIAALSGNLDLARRYMKQARAYQKAQNMDGVSSIITLSNEGFIEKEAENWKKANDLYAKAHILIAEYFMSQEYQSNGNVSNYFELFSDYADLAIKLDDIPKAKSLVKSGKKINSIITSDENNIEGLNFRLLEARIAATEKNWPIAAERIESVIGILTNQREVSWLTPEPDSALLSASPILATAFRISAEIQAAAGTYPLAPIMANCNAGKAVLRKIQLSYAPDVTMDRLLVENQALYDISVEKAYAESTSLGNTESIEAYFLAIEEARDQQLLASVDARQDIAYGLPEDLRTAEAEARQRLRSYERLLNVEQGKQPRNNALILEYGGHLRTARFLIDSIANVIKEAFPEYYELKFRDRPLELREVKDILGQEEAMISFYVTSKKTYGLLITREEAVPFSADLPEERIHTFNKTLLKPSATPTTEWQQQSQALYEQLLGPVRERNLSRLIVVPDKALNFLAWPALLTAAGPPNADWRSLPYLIRSVNLRQEASAGVYVRQRESRSAAGAYSYAGFAPVYNGKSYSMRSDSGITDFELYFPELTRQQPGGLVYNGDEVKYATSLFVNPVAEVGSGATESFFKAIAGNASVLHIASHGITSASDPAASHLLFSKSPEGDEEDGLLHAWEIYGMKIPADLTVLSACQTGTGAIRSGTGVLSLARAFRYAGSKDVVMSLWSVNDRSTYQVMRQFFTGVKENQDKATALQNAMVHHLETAKDDAMVHPYYWAGFSLVGPGEVLDGGQQWWQTWWWLVPMVFFVGYFIRRSISR